MNYGELIAWINHQDAREEQPICNMERSEKFGLFEKQGLNYATWFRFCVQPLFDDNIIKNSYSFSKLFSKYAWKRLERCLDPAHSPFSQEGPKGLESACTTTKVYDQKSQNFCTQDVQRLLVKLNKSDKSTGCHFARQSKRVGNILFTYFVLRRCFRTGSN